MGTKPFQSSMAPLPTDAPSKHDLRTKWRPAGSDANRISAAALGLAINQLPHEFKDISKAWMGFKTALLHPSMKSNEVLCFLIFYLCRCLPSSKHCPPMSVSYDRHPMCFGQGCLMMQNEFYRDLDSGRTIMSLGFKKWCFLSIETEYEEVDGKARLELKIIECC